MTEILRQPWDGSRKVSRPKRASEGEILRTGTADGHRIKPTSPSRQRHEVLSQPPDKTNAMPREASARASGAGPRRPALWGSSAVELDPPAGIWGMYPKTFLPWALRKLRCEPAEVLHVCSGGLAPIDGGIRVDLRSECRPDVVADGRRLPFSDGSFKGVLLDPPYTVEYAETLYGTDYPRPSHLLREAVRVCRPCGRIGFLHFLVPHTPPLTRIVGVWGVWQGCGYRIRALTVLECEQARLV